VGWPIFQSTDKEAKAKTRRIRIIAATPTLVMDISLHRSEQIIQIAVIVSSESYGQNSNSVLRTRKKITGGVDERRRTHIF
jgi:hypothetical protein